MKRIFKVIFLIISFIFIVGVAVHAQSIQKYEYGTITYSYPAKTYIYSFQV